MNKRFLILTVLLLATLLFSCGGDFNGPGVGGSGNVPVIDLTPPSVLLVSPVIGATNVSTTAVVSAVFSEALNPASVNTGSFTLTSSGGPVAGVVSLAGTTAVFTPSVALTPGVVYTATITTGVADQAGNPLASNVSWTFTTAAVVDTTPPVVVSVTPTNGAAGISIRPTLSAVFDESLNPASVTGTTFRVSNGGTSVAGTVSLTGATATFTPSLALSSNTTYSVTLTTGILNLANLALAAPYTWTFTTAIPPSITTTSLPNGAVTGSYSQNLQANGGFGTLTWSVISGSLPAGVSLDPAGLLSSSSISAAPGTYAFTVQVQDIDLLTATQPLSLTVVDGPVVNTTTLPEGTRTGVYTAPTLSATGGSGSYTWAVTSGTLPSNLSLSPGGLLSGIITDIAGTYSFTVEATDTSNNAKASQLLTLLVNDVPSVTTASLPVAQVGILYSSGTMSASGGTLPYSWSAAGLPVSNSLSINAGTGVISGTPVSGDESTYNIGITVTDSNLVTSQTTTLTLIVTAAPLISTATLPDGTTTGVYTAPTLSATGGTPSYGWSANGLPNNLSLSPAGDITGTIIDPAGLYPVIITLQDSVGGTDTKTITLNVNFAPTITTVQADLDTAHATVGSPYSFSMQALDGTGTLSWSASGLPTSLSIGSGGIINGTPVSGDEISSPYTVIFTVTDANLVSTTKTLLLYVDP